jgi:outer membrane immunogenic protein
MFKLRNTLLVSAAVCLGASAALAADLPTMKGPPPAPAPFSWTGFAVGVQAGGGGGGENDNLSTTDFQVTADHFNVNGVIGGANAGYDQQFGSLVLGIRGELDGSGLRGSTSATCGGICSVSQINLAFRNTWQAFLLGRAGIAFDRLLVYAVGGLAAGDDRESATITNLSPVFVTTTAQTDTLYGAAIGVGAEYALDAHWMLGAEYRYAEFDKGNYTAASGPETVRYKAGFSENLGLINLGYRF